MGAARRTGGTWLGFLIGGAVAIGHHAATPTALLAQTANRGVPETRATTRPATRPSTQPTTGTTSQPEEDTVAGLVDRGRRSADLKKYDEARGYYQRAIDKDPSSVPALAGMAAICLKQNKTADSLRYYNQAAQAALSARQYATAEQLLQEAAGIDPNDAQVLLSLAQVFDATKRRVQAIAMFQRYTKVAPNEYVAFLAMGRLQLESKYTRAAIASLVRAEELNARDPETLVTLARAYWGIKEYVKAEEKARLAIAVIEAIPDGPGGVRAVPSQLADYYGTYSEILLEQGKVDEAERQTRRGLELAHLKFRQAPDDRPLLEGMVGLYQVLDEVVRERLKKEPKNPKLWTTAARQRAEQADLREVLLLHDVAGGWAEAAKNAPDDLTVLQELATAQYKLKRMSEASETCGKILKIKPDDKFAQDLLQQIGPVATRPVPATQPTTRP